MSTMLAERPNEYTSTNGPILAVVGSRKFIVPNAIMHAERIIKYYYSRLVPSLVISGGAEGVDCLAISLAAILNIPYQEYLPDTSDWEGYSKRNLAIARECDKMLCIRCHAAESYGSGWTADRASSFDKDVIRLYI